MSTPFPGMDPYLERAELWPDVHNRLIVALADYLSPRVRPRYYVSIEQRTYRQEPGGLRFTGRPDVAVLAEPAVAYRVAPLVELPPVRPITVELPVPDILRETYLDVKDTAGELITCLEILSPANKVPGRGRSMYEHKRRWVLESRTHLVEIDLLRGGLPMEMFGAGNGHVTHYRILVSREERRPRAELLPFTVRHPIPDFTLPLQRRDEDVTVPLNSLLHELYERAGYDLRINYRADPEPPLEGDDPAWADALLCAAGLRA
jgi:hypothetical protein